MFDSSNCYISTTLVSFYDRSLYWRIYHHHWMLPFCSRNGTRAYDNGTHIMPTSWSHCHVLSPFLSRTAANAVRRTRGHTHISTTITQRYISGLLDEMDRATRATKWNVRTRRQSTGREQLADGRTEPNVTRSIAAPVQHPSRTLPARLSAALHTDALTHTHILLI